MNPYEWADAPTCDDLNDVTPIEGGVPIQHVPHALRLVELIDQPGGFEQWAREVLGEYEAIHGERDLFAEYDLDHLEECRNIYRADDSSWPERGRAAREVKEALGTVSAAAIYLGDTELNTLRAIRQRHVEPDTNEQIARLLSEGKSLRETAAQVGVSYGSVRRTAEMLGLQRRRSHNQHDRAVA